MNSDNYDPLAAYRQPGFSSTLALRFREPAVKFQLALIVATAALYGGYLHNPLVFDDYNVLNVPRLQAAWNMQYANILRWLSEQSFALTFQLAGTDWYWYRVENLILHALCVLVLFHLFLAVLKAANKQPSGTSISDPWLAFLGALWFAIHPAAIYGVAYLAQRSIVMATIFGAAALYCYVLALETGKAKWFWGSLSCYFLAMLCKEHAAVLPGIAIGLSLLLRKPAFASRSTFWKPLILISGIGLALALVFVFYRSSVLGTAAEPQAYEIFSQMRQRGMGPNLDNAFLLSVVTQTHLFFKYLALWTIPYTGWMSIDVRQSFATEVVMWPYGLSLGVFLAYPVAAVLLIRKGGRCGLFGFGMAYPWILFLPELAVVRVSEVFVLYRSYIWMSGLPFALMAILAGHSRRIVAAAGALFALAFFFSAQNRLNTFADHLKLWTDAIESNAGKLNQGAERAYFKRGLAYQDNGQYDEAIADFKAGYALQSSTSNPANSGDRGIVFFQFNYLVEVAEDLKELQAATGEIQRNPNSVDAYVRRGSIYARLLRPLQAVKDFSEAIRLSPGSPGEALRNRALVLFKSGGAPGAADALDDLNRAIAGDPKFAKAYMTRGLVLAAQGRTVAAISDLDKAAALSPRDPEIHLNRGNVLVSAKRFEEASRHFGKAIEFAPRLADAYLNRGAILMQNGQFDDAMKDFNTVARLNPDSENAYFNRARIHTVRGEKDAALSDYDRVLKLNHKDADALFERGLLLEEKNLRREARINFQRSCDAGNERGCAKLKEIAR